MAVSDQPAEPGSHQQKSWSDIQRSLGESKEVACEFLVSEAERAISLLDEPSLYMGAGAKEHSRSGARAIYDAVRARLPELGFEEGQFVRVARAVEELKQRLALAGESF